MTWKYMRDLYENSCIVLFRGGVNCSVKAPLSLKRRFGILTQASCCLYLQTASSLIRSKKQLSVATSHLIDIETGKFTILMHISMYETIRSPESRISQTSYKSRYLKRPGSSEIPGKNVITYYASVANHSYRPAGS